MRRCRVVAACMLAAAAVAPIATRAATAPATPARMLVYAQEWSLWPSRSTVPAGRVVVQLWNRGQDQHDLRIRRVGRDGRMTGRAQALAVTNSGAIRTAAWRLPRGRYELYCSLPGHLQHGMHAQIRVI